MPIDVTPDAARQLTRIGEYVESVGHHRQFYPDSYATTVESWSVAQARIWSLLAEGVGGKLWGDTDYSMTLVTSYGMTVGVVWFRDRSYDEAHINREDKNGRPLWIANFCMMHLAPLSPSGYCAKADDTKCFGVEVPIPGTWSLHS